MPRPFSEKEEKQMSILKVPGAQLSYEVSDSGPLLILIPGSAGVGEVFRPLAHHLSAQYQVATYDRRGFSHSSLDGPQNYDQRIETDADDVRLLIEHLTDQPATVFGNSSGALVALEVISTHRVSNYPPSISRVVGGNGQQVSRHQRRLSCVVRGRLGLVAALFKAEVLLCGRLLAEA